MNTKRDKLQISLIGEVSSAALDYANGFRAMGHNVKHYVNLNGWRKNNHPSYIYLSAPWLPFFLRQLVTLFLHIKAFFFLKGDILFIIREFEFPYIPKALNKLIKKLLRRRFHKVIFLPLSCTPTFRRWSKIENTNLCNNCLKFDVSDSNRCPNNTLNLQQMESFLFEMIDHIIPQGFEYNEAYKNVDKSEKFNFIPIDVDEFYDLRMRSKKPFSDKKIVITHGVNRIGFKGTFLVEEAFKKLEKLDYKNVELRITPRQNYHSYLESLLDADIIVDQIFNRSLGKNSLIGIALKKIVVCGCIDESLQSFDISPENSPIISVPPSVDGIFNVLNDLIINKESYINFSDDAYNFLCFHHSPKRISEQILRVVDF